MTEFELFYWTLRFIAYLIIFPTAIGFIRFKKIEPTFRPFFVLVFYDLFTEILYEILTRTVHTNSISYNFYSLNACLIIGYQLYKWNFLDIKSWALRFWVVFIVCFWVIDNLWRNSLWEFNPLSAIFTAMLVCVFSIRAASKVATKIKNHKTRGLIYIIITTWVVKYMILVVAETGWLFFHNLSVTFNNNLSTLETYFGGIVNIIYTIVALWIPKKRKYSWLSP